MPAARSCPVTPLLPAHWLGCPCVACWNRGQQSAQVSMKMKICPAICEDRLTCLEDSRGALGVGGPNHAHGLVVVFVLVLVSQAVLSTTSFPSSAMPSNALECQPRAPAWKTPEGRWELKAEMLSMGQLMSFFASSCCHFGTYRAQKQTHLLGRPQRGAGS